MCICPTKGTCTNAWPEAQTGPGLSGAPATTTAVLMAAGCGEKVVYPASEAHARHPQNCVMCMHTIHVRAHDVHACGTIRGLAQRPTANRPLLCGFFVRRHNSKIHRGWCMAGSVVQTPPNFCQHLHTQLGMGAAPQALYCLVVLQPTSITEPPFTRPATHTSRRCILAGSASHQQAMHTHNHSRASCKQQATDASST